MKTYEKHHENHSEALPALGDTEHLFVRRASHHWIVLASGLANAVEQPSERLLRDLLKRSPGI